jgi:hypothetical protein
MKDKGLQHNLLYMIIGPDEVQKLQAAGEPNCRFAAHTIHNTIRSQISTTPAFTIHNIYDINLNCNSNKY